jgi:hypothetical protein
MQHTRLKAARNTPPQIGSLTHVSAEALLIFVGQKCHDRPHETISNVGYQCTQWQVYDTVGHNLSSSPLSRPQDSTFSPSTILSTRPSCLLRFHQKPSGALLTMLLTKGSRAKMMQPCSRSWATNRSYEGEARRDTIRCAWLSC